MRAQGREQTYRHRWIAGAMAGLAILTATALLELAPPASAAETGAIAGQVRNSAGKAPLAGIEVCAQLPEIPALAGGEERHRRCDTSGAGGEYEIDSLPALNGSPPGGYEVEFNTTLDFIRQFYSGKLEDYSATLVPIVPGKTVQGIDAELEEGGEIHGRITSAATGEPVPGAEACANEYTLRTICATAGASGEYTIVGLISHSYRVYFNGPGGLQSEYIGQYYREKEWPEIEPVNVAAPGIVTGIDAALKSYGRITGKVIDKATKQPLAGVNVCGGNSCENTNAAGEYSFTKLLAGSYTLTFYATRMNEEKGTDYLSQYEANEYLVQEELKARNPEAAHVQVTMSGHAVINDELEEGGRITGTMLEAGTKAPAGVWTCAEDLSTGHPAQSRVCPYSESGDTYTISGLPPGRYRVVFGDGLPAYMFTQYYKDSDLQSEAKEIVVASGKTVKGIDASLTANPDPSDGAIAGTATDAASKAAIAGIEVCAFQNGRSTSACANTGPNGEYLITGVGSSTAEVEFRSPAGGALDYASQVYPGGGVSVTLGSITPAINAQLQPGGRISGVVQSEATKQPLGGVSVCAFDENHESRACATSEAGGAYTLTGLAGGTYTVGFEVGNAGGSWFPQYFREVSLASEAQKVSVEAGQTTGGIDGSLIANDHPGDGALAGTVTDASSDLPIAGIEVCAYQLGFEELFGECTTTTTGGHYVLTGLPPGEYELEFSSPANSAISYEHLLYDAGEPVAVAADSITSGLDGRLTAAGRLSGTVTSAATEKPVPGIAVCAFDEATEAGGCAPSLANGTYAITGLPPGSYQIVFYGTEQGFALQYYDDAAEPSQATEVKLSSGQSVGGIDARLQPGGSISGTVTNGLTGRPMEEVLICALTGEPDALEALECAISGAGGEYQITGLPQGQWIVGFDAGRGYEVQYYDGVTEPRNATRVTVTGGHDTAGIDATIRTPPAKPVQPPPAQTISTASPAPPPAPAGSGVLGLTTAKAVAKIALAGQTVSVSGRSATLSLSCIAAACHGLAQLSVRVSIYRRVHGRRVRHVETIVLGRGSFVLATGARGSVHLKLTPAGVKRLAHVRSHPLAAQLDFGINGAPAQTRTVKVR